MNFSKINCVKFFEIIKFLRFIGLILPNFCRLLNLIFNDHLLILIYLDKYVTYTKQFKINPSSPPRS